MADLTLEQQRAIAIAQARAKVQAQQPQTPEARQAAVQERVKMFEQRDKAIAAQEELAQVEARRNDRMLRWQMAPDANYRATMMMTEFIPTLKDTMLQAGIVGGGAAIGQQIGSRAGRPGRAAGGAVGAAMGSMLEQGVDVYAGEQDKINMGEVISSAMAGATTTRNSGGNALANVAAETVRSLIDEQTLPSAEQVGQAAAAGYIAGKVSQKMTGKSLAPEDALFQYRNDAFRALRKEGIRVNPQLLSRGSKVLTTIAGENPLNTATSRLNQPIYQKLVREELGLSKKPLPIRPRQDPDPATGKVLVKGELDEVIEKASKPYEEIREIADEAQRAIDDFKAGRINSHPLINRTPQEAQALLNTNKNLDALKEARQAANDARARMKAGDPEAFNDFTAAKKAEDTLEAQIELAADIAGKPDLVQQLKESRVKLAKAFAVREATDAFGIVDVNELSRMRATPSKPGRFLTGRLKELADFAEAFGPSAQDSVAVAVERNAGVAMNYSARQAALGRASGYASAGVPVVSDHVKQFLLNDAMQSHFARPRFQFNPETMAPSAAREFLMATGRGEEIRVPFAPEER